MVSLDVPLTGGAAYRVIATARTDKPHNRTEGHIRSVCGGGSPTAVRFTKDYASPKTGFATPTVIIVLTDGQSCKITADWLIGGGGNVGETGVSSATVVDTTVQNFPKRFEDDTKASAKSLRDASRRAAAKNYAAANQGNYGLPLVPAVVESVLGAVAGRIASDPPDPHYRTVTKRVRVAARPVGTVPFGSSTAAMNAYLAAGSDAAASGIALTTAIDRAQGARISKRRADRKPYDRKQMLAAAGFGARLAGELKTLRARKLAAGRALRACGCPLATATVSDSDWSPLRDSLVTSRTPAPLAAELKRMRVQPDLIRSAGLDLGTIDQLLPGTIADEMVNNQELHTIDNLRISLAAWAKAAKRTPTATPPG